jgi:hypothetical protein
MKPIAKDELYKHTSEFLKARGIELKEGSYSGKIQKGFGLLTDAINLTQKGIKKASVELDTKLDQLRQAIHEKTAPKTAAPPPAPKSNAKSSAAPKTRVGAKKKGSKGQRRSR